ncbi:MAG: hypothetical protein BYD32DRAFT_459873 [Podila humilis]|nr:MAG: hypothetical protein BYD32DRAFT_459873 [Podila humilis]
MLNTLQHTARRTGQSFGFSRTALHTCHDSRPFSVQAFLSHWANSSLTPKPIASRTHPRHGSWLLFPKKYSSSSALTSKVLPRSPSSTAATKSSSSIPPRSASTLAVKSTSIPKPKASSTRRVQHEWNPQLDAIMLALYEAKINWRAIGNLLDRPFTTCYTRYLKIIRPALENGWIPPQIEDHTRLSAMIHKAQVQAADALSNRFKIVQPFTVTEASIKSKTLVRPSWDKDMDQRIIDLLQEGKTWPQIGVAMDRPYSSCYTRYYTALDPSLKDAWTPEKIEMLNKLAKEGKSWKHIGKDLGIRPLACKAKWADLGKLASTETQKSATSSDNSSSAPSPAVRVVAFSKAESLMIIDLVEKYGQEDKWDRILKDFQQQSLDIASHRSRISSWTKRRIQDITADNLRHQFMRLSRTKVLWTFDQETSLIQQVLKLGTDDDKWKEIAKRTGFHSPEECRSHWKQLDMPVNLNSTGWTKVEQSTFWELWLKYGSDFDRLSVSCSPRSPGDCQRFFDHATRDFSKQDPGQFRQQVQALLKSQPTTRQKYMFTKERSLKLQQAMRFYGKKIGSKTTRPGTWRWIASKVQRGLSPTSCIEHWSYLRQNMDVVYGPLEEDKTAIKPQNSSSWSHDELKLLDQGIRELGSGWSDIQQRYLPWRTTRSIRQRWLIMSDKSARVTEDEYYKILQAGDDVQGIDWTQLVKQMPGWNKLPCRRVFECSYKHLIKHTVWQPEEDHLLVEKTLEEHGRDWNTIAAHFKGIQPAMAPLYTPSSDEIQLQRTHKTAWQCRLRWCQLVEPLMPKGPSLTATESSRSFALKLSKQLLSSPHMLPNQSK